jgi:hypothetical protein
MNFRSLLTLLAASLLVGAVAHRAMAAPITYVDATSGVSGNTALAAGGVFSPPLNGTTNLDNQWEQRTTFGNGGNIFETSGEGPAVTENAPRIVTTVSGLTPGQPYKLYAYFWSPNDINQQWLLRAGLTDTVGDLPSWSRLGNDAVNNAGGVVGTDADSFFVATDNVAPFPATGPADFANPGALFGTTVNQAGKAVISESSRYLWQALVGTKVADSNGQAQIYIDDYVLGGGAPPAGTQTVNLRTWYDGVGYELVPEPSALLMLLFAAPALVARRHRSS